ncbi:MAG: IS3 family transposase [Firmicutes bacterium]|nr:IS3 family transposase [Bacillota bacterium]
MRALCESGEWGVSRLCSIADVSRKNYYRYLKQPDISTEDAGILKEIRDLQTSNHGGIGYRPMTSKVSGRLGYLVNSKHILRLMRENDLLSAVRRRKYSDEVYARRRELKGLTPPDLIQRWFFALEPRTRLVEDITYLPGKERTEYLNAIEDLFNGEILAWSISTSPDALLCTTTVKKLCEIWGECFSGTILHSDLGSSYMSYDYMKELDDHGFQMSVGKKGCCYDNAAMESLNGIVKTESLYCRFGKTKVKEKRIPIEEIRNAAIAYIDYYNNERPKKALGWMSPVEFRLRNPRGTYPVLI